MMLVNVKLDITRYKRIAFQGRDFIGTGNYIGTAKTKFMKFMKVYENP